MANTENKRWSFSGNISFSKEDVQQMINSQLYQPAQPDNNIITEDIDYIDVTN